MMPKLFVALCALGANAFLPKTPLSARPARAPARTAPRALLDVFVAGQLATAPIDASKLDLPSTVVISAKEKIQREGLYGSYEVEVDNGFNPADDARSTFKSKAATKKGKNKYLGIFVVLLVGSFIIPMAQYFWYVRDTPDGLFNEPPPPPPPPAPKKFWER